MSRGINNSVFASNAARLASNAARLGMGSFGLAAVMAALLIAPPSSQAVRVNFGCSHEDRSIAAVAKYRKLSPGFIKVKTIRYSYSNSGGGKSNTYFTLYNRKNLVAWNAATPDDRDDGRTYRYQPNTKIARGGDAAIKQKTYFDVTGNDPSCTGVRAL